MREISSIDHFTVYTFNRKIIVNCLRLVDAMRSIIGFLHQSIKVASLKKTLAE